MPPGFQFPRLDLPLIPLPFSLCTLFLRTLLILRFFVSSVRIACSLTSLVLRFFVSSVHQILQLCFAGSAILRQFRTSDSEILHLCFAGSTILCQFSTLDPAFQSCKCASPILRFCVGSTSKLYFVFRSSANSSILCRLRESCCGFR